MKLMKNTKKTFALKNRIKDNSLHEKTKPSMNQ
jgi:hypothetical protein